VPELRLVYPPEDLLRDPPYAAEHRAAGHRLHGGFDASGRYLSPRSALRGEAVAAWQARLAERGFPLLAADPATLLRAGPYPSTAQQKLLLRHGLGQTLWNTLSITGQIEARGRLLCDLVLPDFAPLVEHDLTPTAVGHLNRGLLRAHGLDEGGDPERGIGGHDAMWFAIRDLVFDAGRWPEPAVPASIARPDEARRLAPALPAAHERTLTFLMNVLLIEVRAEAVFAFVESLLADPTLFADRRPAAEEALALVGRIREDEAIHVAYLRTVLSELRSFVFRGADGARHPGATLLDPIWDVLVHWHAVENPRLARAQQRELLRARILAHAPPAGGPDPARILEEFFALEPPPIAG